MSGGRPYFPSAVLGVMAATREVEGGGGSHGDTCRGLTCGHVAEAGLDTASTAAQMDPLELAPLARLRLALQEHRARLLPGALILGGSITTIVSVGRNKSCQLTFAKFRSAQRMLGFKDLC